jgi:acyl-CoA thioesterase-1
MKHLLLFIMMLFILSACSSEEEQGQTQVEYQEEENISEEQVETTENLLRIIAFGDSLTEGYGIDKQDAYPAQLEAELKSRGYDVTVVNSGYSGETSTGALNRVDWVTQRSNPDIVILTIGANDAIRGIDLSITKSNIESIVDILEQENITVILSGMEIYDNLGETYTNEFREIYSQIAQDKNLTFIPLFLEGVAADPSLNIEDQIHPNKEGYNIVVTQNILPVLEPILKEYINEY